VTSTGRTPVSRWARRWRDPLIRPARADDVPAIYQLVRDLAEYERSLHQVSATEEDLRRSLMADQPAVFAHVAEHEGEVVGVALWFVDFSTWEGQHGIYLEDLYVRPDVRGGGHGRALLAELARICVQRGYPRLTWAVLDWNSPALGFYRSLGAVFMDDWQVHQLAGAALHTLAGARRAEPAG
jgi:GNAT superfamily N-acetyltransferase